MTEKLADRQVTVSVVIPFFSGLAWLEEALDSVLAQRFGDYEIIVVNDGSAEDLSGLSRKYGDRIVWLTRGNGGPGAARNTGIAAARGKYIAFLDADDLWHEDKLSLQVARMEETGAVWSHTDWQTFRDGDVNLVVRKYVSDCAGFIFPRSLISTVIATPCVMVRADTFKEHAELRFNEGMRYGQDYYLWLLLSAEYPIELIRQSLCFVRYRGSNAIERARVHLQLRRNIWDQFKQKKKAYFYRERKYFPIRAVYRLCVLEEIVVGKLEKWFLLNDAGGEILARIFYIIPYAFFLLLKRLYSIKKCNDE